MFPLGSVLLPGSVLPLHVFEPRYRALVADCIESDDHEFGVTLIERGSEVGGGDRRTTVGTVARMVQVAELEDGRYAVICVGTRRIRVNAWLPDDPYPLADVDEWPDDEAELYRLDDRITVTTGRVRRACALANELGDSTADPSADIADEPVQATYQLAAMAPVGPADVHALLAAPGPLARLDLLDHLLDDVEVVLRFRLSEPGNGFEIDEM
jgi:Lon protease-like protein